MALQLRRGTNADRVAVAGVLAAGELYYCTDTKVMWVGDGATAGGTEVGSSTPYTDLYNVKLWGAVGDGVTDDTAAIQDAIDAAGAAGGGEVVIPNGEFVLSVFLEMNIDGVVLSGHGPSSRLIAPTGSGDFCIKTSASGLAIRNIAFVGGVSTSPAAANECISMLGGTDGLEISGCLFTGADGTKGFNVQIRGESGVVNPRICNNHFERVVGTAAGYGYGIQMASVVGGVISGNVSMQGVSRGRHHVYLSVSCSDISVTGNRFYGGNSSMVTVYSATTSGGRISVCGNTFDGAGTGGGTGGAVEIVGPISNCSVVGNTIYNVSGYGVKIEAAAASQCLDNVVSANVIKSPGLGGVYIRGAENTVIAGNSIVDAGAGVAAIYLQAPGTTTANGTVVAGNSVTGSGHVYAISLAGSNVSVFGNRFVAGSSGVYAVTDPTKRYILGNNDSESPKVYSAVATAAANDTTPTVGGVRTLLIPANVAATEITQLDNGVAYQTVTIVATSATNPPTIADGGNFSLSAAWAPTVNSTITLFTVDGSAWVEVSRSQN